MRVTAEQTGRVGVESQGTLHCARMMTDQRLHWTLLQQLLCQTRQVMRPKLQPLVGEMIAGQKARPHEAQRHFSQPRERRLKKQRVQRKLRLHFEQRWGGQQGRHLRQELGAELGGQGGT